PAGPDHGLAAGPSFGGDPGEEPAFLVHLPVHGPARRAYSGWARGTRIPAFPDARTGQRAQVPDVHARGDNRRFHLLALFGFHLARVVRTLTVLETLTPACLPRIAITDLHAVIRLLFLRRIHRELFRR